MARAAILFLTHKWNEVIRLRFERLRGEVGTFADVYLLMQKSPAATLARSEGEAVARALAIFDADRLPRLLGYPYAFNGSMLPGSVHFAVLAFSQRLAHSHYFLVEYDVEFSGHWLEPISATLATDPDFASHHFFTHAQKPDWGWWYFAPGKADRDWAGKRENLIRSFNPVFCLSHRATELLHAAHRDGWRAHHEMLLPTLLSRRGCRIIDIGKLTGFCLGNEQEPCPGMAPAALSSIRWQPDVTLEEARTRSRDKVMFHPVKDAWHFDGSDFVAVGPHAEQHGRSGADRRAGNVRHASRGRA